MALVLTVLNERESLPHLLRSIQQQTRIPDEIVIVDGGSEDGTWDLIQEWREKLPLRAVQARGANISQGRNLAIQSTSSELIAVTDAGVVLCAEWLERLVAAAAGADVVSGFFQPDARSLFEWAMGATVLPSLSDVQPDGFLPSSRSVLFHRSRWLQVGGYPEWLDYCEDLVFDLSLRASACSFVFEPGALVFFRPRSSLRAFFKQYYRYARGDGKANLWPRRHAVRYVSYLTTPLLLRLCFRFPEIWLLLVAAVMAYSRRPYQRLWRSRRTNREFVRGLGLIPVIRLTGDIAKMVGYPVGLRWRFAHRA